MRRPEVVVRGRHFDRRWGASRRITDSVVARLVLAAAIVALVVVPGGMAASPASAHHGDTGDYLRTAPVLVVGSVETVEIGFPHAEVTVVTTGTAAQEDIPAGFAALDTSEAAPILAQLAQPLGTVRLVFDPVLTGELGAVPPLQIGDQLIAVAYPRCLQGTDYDNELRVQAVRFPTGEEMLRGDAGIVDYVDACDVDSQPTLTVAPLTSRSEVPSSPDSTEAPSATNSPSSPAADGPGMPVIIVILGALAALVAGIIVVGTRIGRGSAR